MKTIFFLIALFVVMACGCAPKMIMTPEVATESCGAPLVTANIDYKGNKDYLPRILATSQRPESPFTARYRYDVSYGRDSVNQVLPLFNPLNFVGFPIGADTVVVKATLEFIRDTIVGKRYVASCVLSKHRNLFWEGESLTELRRRGLIAVRDNIESQVCRDKDFVRELSTGQ